MSRQQAGGEAEGAAGAASDGQSVLSRLLDAGIDPQRLRRRDVLDRIDDLHFTPGRVDEMVSIHESGHAVIGLLNDMQLIELSIDPDRDSFGRIGWSHPVLHASRPTKSKRRVRQATRQVLRHVLAGYAAEWKDGFGWPGPVFQVAAGEPDSEAAIELAAQLSPDDPWSVIDRCWRDVSILVEDPVIWAVILGLAELLRERRVLCGDEATMMVTEALRDLSGAP